MRREDVANEFPRLYWCEVCLFKDEISQLPLGMRTSPYIAIGGLT